MAVYDWNLPYVDGILLIFRRNLCELKHNKDIKLMRETLIKIWDLSIDKTIEDDDKLNEIYKECSKLKDQGIWLN